MAVYEDTGLTPDVCKNYKLFEDELISKGITFNELLRYIDKINPKKITYQEYEYEGKKVKINGIDGVPYDLCPTCKTNLCTSGVLSKRKTKYCVDCGQRLDWSK